MIDEIPAVFKCHIQPHCGPPYVQMSDRVSDINNHVSIQYAKAPKVTAIIISVYKHYALTAGHRQNYGLATQLHAVIGGYGQPNVRVHHVESQWKDICSWLHRRHDPNLWSRDRCVTPRSQWITSSCSHVCVGSFHLDTIRTYNPCRSEHTSIPIVGVGKEGRSSTGLWGFLNRQRPLIELPWKFVTLYQGASSRGRGKRINCPMSLSGIGSTRWRMAVLMDTVAEGGEK